MKNFGERLWEQFKLGTFAYSEMSPSEKSSFNKHIKDNNLNGEFARIQANVTNVVKGGEKDMSGYDAAKAKADALKQEASEKITREVATREQVQKQLEAMKENPVLADFMKQNAKLGAENLGGASYPYLRIHTDRSTSNELANGKRPTVGQLFYSRTKEAYGEIIGHILTISKGFYMEQEDRKTKEKKLQFNQLVGGVIVDNGVIKPFLMYINGVKCQSLWSFAKQAAVYTKMGIPLFMMVVRISTEEIKTDNGYNWVPKFELVNENGMPEMVIDMETLDTLKNGVLTLEENIQTIIDTYSVSKESGDGEVLPVTETRVNSDEEEVAPAVEEGVTVSPDDIPF